mgnify:CR=1 FL=1
MTALPLKKAFEKLFPKSFSMKSNQKYLDHLLLYYKRKDWKKFITLLRNAIAMVEERERQLEGRAGRSGEGSNLDVAAKRMSGEEERLAEASKEDRATVGEKKGKNKKRKRKQAEAGNNKSGLSDTQFKSNEAEQEKKSKPMNPKLRKLWHNLRDVTEKFASQVERIQNNFAFSFVEGSLVKAVRQGKWVLLDEINLASPETLESISGLLDGGSICLTERGDVNGIPRHPDFRLFACMNPATDVGKKDLAPGLRNRFSEFWVDEIRGKEDLHLFVREYLRNATAEPPVDDIVSFYLDMRSAATLDLVDGANHRPHYSLRTLVRAMAFTRQHTQYYGFSRALYEGFSMSFLTQLSTSSIPKVEGMLQKYFIGSKAKVKQFLKEPKCPGQDYVACMNIWIQRGSEV